MSEATAPDNLRSIATSALAFTESRDAALPSALIRYQWFEGPVGDVVAALEAYQNDDGGFGHRLEPDIHSAASNPFAARISMQYLRYLPEDVAPDMRSRLQQWLIANQHEDGDWHFTDATKADFLQPWFAAWEFPALNPACCVAGLANSLGLATDEMMARVAKLFAEKSSLERVSDGGFYDLLPYVEYSLGVQLPDEYLDAIAASIINRSEAGELEDAEHFFTLACGGSPEITARIPESLIVDQRDRMMTEPLGDGGWPTPYDDWWRVWITAGNLATLTRLGSIAQT